MNILIPHSWLLEYFKTNLKPAEIAERLSLCGVSVEKVEKIVADGKAEYVYDIEVTSNRPDLLSVIGVAREAGAVFKKKCAFPALFKIPASDEMMPLRIEIRDPDLCPRYLGIVLQDIAVGPSPDFISERLKLSRLRPINNVVDITNYVMLEYGQPLHAFDWDLLAKNEKGEAEIIARKARQNEKMTTLDKQNLDLEPEMLVIADSAGPIALAGIKGGAKAEVTEKTKTIVLECANFNPVSIRKTSRKLSLATDASARFEKGLSALGLEVPFGRAIYLLEKFAQGRSASSYQDVYPKKLGVKKVNFYFKTLEKILGVKIPDNYAQEILLSLGFKIKKQTGGLEVTVPYWRYCDIGIEEDLVEEIARIYGYDRLKGKLLDTAMPAETRSKSFAQEEKAKDILAGAGLTEVYTYSFVSQDLLAKAG
ncbi:MAG: phenylalanine--tRNA ligase subunit beta, partial [bacterium]|nr:phenylalanine--tRNA ligase subunit beta [bacterium]